MGKRILVVAIAVLLAAASAFVLMQYMNNLEDEIRKGEEMQVVFRAVQHIPEGARGSEILTQGELAFVQSEEQVGDLPGGAITTEEALRTVLSGRVAIGPIPANGIFVDSMWAVPSVAVAPLTNVIDPNMEAITVAPDLVSGVNGFVQPDDLVNIIVTLSLPIDMTAIPEGTGFGVPTEQATEGEAAASEEVTYTRRILAQVPVLAVGTIMKPEEGVDPPVVQNAAGEAVIGGTAATVTETGEEVEPEVSTVFTLMVNAEDAERLVFAQSEGVIYFTLPAKEYEVVETRGVALVNLFGRGANVVDDIFGD